MQGMLATPLQVNAHSAAPIPTALEIRSTSRQRAPTRRFRRLVQALYLSVSVLQVPRGCRVSTALATTALTLSGLNLTLRSAVKALSAVTL